MARKGMRRTWELRTVPSNSQRISWPSFTYSRVASMARETMEKNVSEAKEQASFKEIRAIATWYLKERMKNAEQPETVEQAILQMKLEAEEKRKLNAEKKKRKAEENKENEEPPKKKRRSKKLSVPLEQIEHMNNKRKKHTPNKKNLHQVRRENAANKMTRAIAFAFYPSAELRRGLERWLVIADQIDLHVKEVVERFAAQDEKPSFEYIRDECVCLSKKKHDEMTANGTLETLRYMEKRKRYITMPVDIQQAIIKESNAGCSSAQTNYEKGNNNGYDVREKDASRRFRTLQSLSSGMCVDRITGTVTISPECEFVPKDCDRGVYIKDRLIHHLCEKVLIKGGVSYLPTCEWGNELLVGKKHGGSGFTLRYDSIFRKWSLILAIDAFQRGAPFRPEIQSRLLNDTRKCTRRARRWITRTENIFSRATSVVGNLCSIDPGVRTPWTCYDSHERQCYDVYPDMVDKLADLQWGISRLQKRQTIPPICKDVYRKRKRKRKKWKKKESGRKRKKPRRRRRSLHKKILVKYDKISSIVRQAHNAFTNHLVRNYDTIILPEFMTKRMVQKRRRQMKLPPIREPDEGVNDTKGPREGAFTLHKTTRKAMRNISHFKFRQRLVAKALADPHRIKTVNITTEEYTTKQCPFCDFIHHKIGSNKVFKCGNVYCGFVGDRDCVGGFNIKLRSIIKNEIAVAV